MSAADPSGAPRRGSVIPRGAAIVAAIALTGCAGATSTTTAIAPTTVAVTTTSPVSTTTTTAPPSTTTLPPRPIDPAGLTIPEMQEAMAEASLTSVSLTRWYLGRIVRFDSEINSVIAIYPGAMLAAIESDRLRRAGVILGPLHGIPIVLKDNIGTGDMPTTAGSVALEGFIPIADATQVARLRAAGAIILAKTNLYEFARDIRTISSLGGVTRNPYDLSLNPGGSSGGTGAAVAAEFGAAGLGTDTCGSIRIPAAFNHLYGLRPTVGLTPTEGVIPLSFTEDTAGPLARSVIDLAIVLDITAASGDRYTAAALGGSLEGVRIGVVDLLFSGADPAVAAAGRTALDLMAANGAEIVPAPIPGFDSLRGNAATVFLREWRPALDEYLAAQPDAPYRSLAEIAASGRYLPALSGPISRALGSTLESSEYRNALERRTVVQEAIEGWMDDNDLDALAYPPISQPPAPIGSGQEGNNCGTASVGGLPAIVIPAGFTSQGWPVGLELMGRRLSEETLIGIAAGYEKVAPEWVGPDLGDGS